MDSGLVLLSVKLSCNGVRGEPNLLPLNPTLPQQCGVIPHLACRVGSPSILPLINVLSTGRYGYGCHGRVALHRPVVIHNEITASHWRPFTASFSLACLDRPIVLKPERFLQPCLHYYSFSSCAMHLKPPLLSHTLDY